MMRRRASAASWSRWVRSVVMWQISASDHDRATNQAGRPVSGAPMRLFWKAAMVSWPRLARRTAEALACSYFPLLRRLEWTPRFPLRNREPATGLILQRLAPDFIGVTHRYEMVREPLQRLADPRTAGDLVRRGDDAEYRAAQDLQRVLDLPGSDRRQGVHREYLVGHGAAPGDVPAQGHSRGVCRIAGELAVKLVADAHAPVFRRLLV